MTVQLVQRNRSLQFAGGDAAQQLFFLGVAAQLADQATGQNDRFHVGFQADALAQLFHDQHGLNAGAAETAQLLGEGNGGQAQLTQLLPECSAEAGFALAECLAAFKVVNVANQAFCGFLQHLLLFSQFEIHGQPPQSSRIIFETMFFWISLDPPKIDSLRMLKYCEAGEAA